MSDEKDDSMKPAKDEPAGKWSTSAKVGAAVGSAAVAAALIYAGRHKMKKVDDFKGAEPKPGMRYENEPDLDEDDDLTAAYYGNDDEE